MQSSTAKRMGVMVTVFGMGLMHLIISFGNLTDYWTNFEFVKHVLSMDTLFPQTRVLYRALPQTWVHHLVYGLIIGFEIVLSVLFLSASVSLYQGRKADVMVFGQAKKWAYWGVAAGLLLWFISFTIVGGEWFSMWQSSIWNATATARSQVMMFLLLYLALITVD